jgi:hypothetical protein
MEVLANQYAFNDFAIGKMRKELRSRIDEIETILQELDFYISDKGKIVTDRKSKSANWWSIGLGSILLCFEKGWSIGLGIALITAGLDGPIKNFIYQKKFDSNCLKFKELELELSRIRRELFGSWSNWTIDLGRLDEAVVCAIKNRAYHFSIDKNGKPTSRVTLYINPKNYEADMNVGYRDKWVDPGTVELILECTFY